MEEPLHSETIGSECEGFSYTHKAILPHIFRFDFGGGFGRAPQGGRGVFRLKEGENYFPFTLFYLIC